MPFELKPCAFQKWARFDSWPIRQTAFVLLGHEPPSLADLFPASNKDYLSSLSSPLTWGDLFDGIVDQEPFFDLKRIDPTEGSALLDMARMLDLAVQNNNIPWKRLIENRFSVIHVEPADVLVWARQKRFLIPAELDALFSKIKEDTPSTLSSRANFFKTYPVAELVNSVCSQSELEEAFLSDELPGYILLPVQSAYNDEGTEVKLAPGVYRILSEDAKSLVACHGREGKFILMGCFSEPNPNQQAFYFLENSPCCPPRIRYEDLRVAHSDLLRWCEAKGKKPKFLFPQQENSYCPEQEQPGLPESLTTQFVESDLLSVIYRLMLLMVDLQKQIDSKRVRAYQRGQGISANALVQDMAEVANVISLSTAGCGEKKTRMILAAAQKHGKSLIDACSEYKESS